MYLSHPFTGSGLCSCFSPSCPPLFFFFCWICWPAAPSCHSISPFPPILLGIKIQKCPILPLHAQFYILSLQSHKVYITWTLFCGIYISSILTEGQASDHSANNSLSWLRERATPGNLFSSLVQWEWLLCLTDVSKRSLVRELHCCDLFCGMWS